MNIRLLVWIVVVLAVGCNPAETETASKSVAPRGRPSFQSISAGGPRLGGSMTLAMPEEGIEAGIDIDALLGACLPEDRLKEGWLRLFDGQSLEGWFFIGTAQWRVVDDAITVDSGQPSFLCTNFQIDDFELMVDFRCPETTKSGILVRSSANPQDFSSECYKVSISPASESFPTGSLVDRKKADDESLGEVSPDTWHTIRLRAEGDQTKIWLDDRLALEYVDPNNRRRGFICLEHQQGEIRFKNILMRPLGIKKLPLGEDWETAWTKAEKENGSFRVEAKGDGLRLKGGSGRLESQKHWGDFVLQATYQLPNPDVNSGIFFRCVPGSFMDGYECQINHSINGHRALPTDYGPGGIFRRKQARIVVGDGVEPTYLTIIADGSQFTTWINGLEVADFADTREPNDNPRRGARREKGSIQLQGHDEKTEIVFHSIAVVGIDAN